MIVRADALDQVKAKLEGATDAWRNSGFEEPKKKAPVVRHWGRCSPK
jgi:hypothetical protein